MYDEKNASGVPDIFFSVYMMQRGGGKEMFFRCRREEKMVYSESEKVFYRKPD